MRFRDLPRRFRMGLGLAMVASPFLTAAGIGIWRFGWPAVILLCGVLMFVAIVVSGIVIVEQADWE